MLIIRGEQAFPPLIGDLRFLTELRNRNGPVQRPLITESERVSPRIVTLSPEFHPTLHLLLTSIPQLMNSTTEVMNSYFTLLNLNNAAIDKNEVLRNEKKKAGDTYCRL